VYHKEKKNMEEFGEESKKERQHSYSNKEKKSHKRMT